MYFVQAHNKCMNLFLSYTALEPDPVLLTFLIHVHHWFVPWQMIIWWGLNKYIDIHVIVSTDVYCWVNKEFLFKYEDLTCTCICGTVLLVHVTVLDNWLTNSVRSILEMEQSCMSWPLKPLNIYVIIFTDLQHFLKKLVDRICFKI